MSDLAWNVWGAVAGVIGIIMVVPVLFTWFLSRMPSAKLPPLLELMKETQDLFAVALREGCITDGDESYQYSLNIYAAAIQVDEVRMKVYAAKTLPENISNWWHGLSGRINALQEELSGIRVELIEKHSRERKKRASQANFSSFSSDSKGLLSSDVSVMRPSYGNIQDRDKSSLLPLA
ncbi:hypothetical protein BV20DRAFT_1056736 [Pilatotrama ljubarskyi]|nr:hypothetical protein BV20DRAFT_1056736 [Pilatotrama ljubarskyi]